MEEAKAATTQSELLQSGTAPAGEDTPAATAAATLEGEKVKKARRRKKKGAAASNSTPEGQNAKLPCVPAPSPALAWFVVQPAIFSAGSGNI
jgi:hypothetical protein